MVRLLHLFKARKSSSLIFGMFLMVAMLTTAMRPAMAQTLTPSDFTCTYDTKPFTCDGGNGAIIFNVVTVFGDTLHFDNDGNCSFPGGSCVSGAFRYRRHGSDTIYTSHSNEVTGMNHGVYDVTWAAQYQPEGSSSFISIGYSSDTWDVVTIDSLYSPFLVHRVGQEKALNSWSFGCRPSLPCARTGRIQLNIDGGTFPFTIILKEVATGHNDTVVFNDHQHFGTDSTMWDYINYYTFDSLAAGEYRIESKDGCGAVNPEFGYTVSEVKVPVMTSISFHGYNDWPYTDSNVVRWYSAHLTEGDVYDYLDDAYAEHVQYRVCYGTKDTSDWKPFPLNPGRVYQNTDKSWTSNNDIRDTAHNVSSYCQLDGEKLAFQYRITFCGQTDTVTRYTYPLGNEVYLGGTTDSVRYDRESVTYDVCTYTIPEVLRYSASRYYYFYGNSTSSTTETPSSYSGYYYTMYTSPLTWKLIDTVRNEVVLQQTYTDGNTSFLITKNKMEELYGSFTGYKDFPVIAEVTDAKGCKVTCKDVFNLYNDTLKNVVGNREFRDDYRSWEYSDDMHRCCQAPRGFDVFEYFSNISSGESHVAQPDPEKFKYLRDGAQIKLVRSPRADLRNYNFTATYSYDSDSWTFEPEDEQNGIEISKFECFGCYYWGYDWGISIRDYCLPYGDYDFQLISDCDTLRHTVQYRDYEQVIEMTTEPKFTLEQECEQMFISLQDGQFSRIQLGSDTYDSNQPEMEMGSLPLNTYFKIVPELSTVGGYPIGDYRVGETITLTKPGTYVLRMYTLDTSEYCRANVFDTTITYVGGYLFFKQNPVAFVCDAEGEVGYVFSSASGGMAPYTYTLSDAEGHVLAQNNVGNFLNLPDVHINQELTLHVTDQCGWEVVTTLPLRDFKSSMAIWYSDEDGVSRMTTTQKCEGTEITVSVSSLDENFTYHWFTRDGSFDEFTADAKVLIPRTAAPAWYIVNVGFTGCSAGYKDSIYVDVIRASEVAISGNPATVCPGEEVTLTFTPTINNSSTNISYVIGKEENSVITYLPYSGTEPGHYTYTANSVDRFWVHSVTDDLCDYTIPENSVEIALRDMTTACDVAVTEYTTCYNGEATLTAYSTTLTPPYTVNWYETPYRTTPLKTDQITSATQTSTYQMYNLTSDTAVYVTVTDDLHCETYTGTVQRWMNFDAGTVTMKCGENLRLFDSGGSSSNYGDSENDTLVFRSDNVDDHFTLTFNSFNTQQNYDALKVYSGTIADPDSLLGMFSGDALPDEVSSRSNSMMLCFTSSARDNAAGWDAMVGCSALPAKAEVEVLDPISVTLSFDPELPARYEQPLTITATASGGRGQRYSFYWEYSTPQHSSYAFVSSEERDTNVSTISISSYNESRYYRVTVQDASTNACIGSAVIDSLIEVYDIKLSLDLASSVSEICQEEFTVNMTVSNNGGATATNVFVKPNIPQGMRLADMNDTLIFIGDVPGDAAMPYELRLLNEAYYTAPTAKTVQAQIWACDQGDGYSMFHNWDWTGAPNENDEAEATIQIRPSIADAIAPGVSVDPQSVCYGSNAHLEAVSTLENPSFTWYFDPALTRVVSTDRWYDVTLASEREVYYVTVATDAYCPAYGPVDYSIKLQNPVTDTVLICNGSTQVGNHDHVRFFDDGGPNNNYTAGKTYTYRFNSLDGSPLVMAFDDESVYQNVERITLYDGDNIMVSHSAQYTGDQLRNQAFVANSGKILVRFTAGNYSQTGFSAHVVTTNQQMAAEAVVTAKMGAAGSITTEDVEICYGEDANLKAFSTIAYPQTFHWYDADRMNVVFEQTVNEGEYSTYTISHPEMESTYYVTVTNDTTCPFVAQVYNNEIEVWQIPAGETSYSHRQDLSAGTKVNFYDPAGLSDSYRIDDECVYYYYHFSTEDPDAYIHVHFNSVNFSNNNGSFYIYDENANRQITSSIQELNGFDSVIHSNRIYIYFGACERYQDIDWDGYVCSVNPVNVANLAEVNMSFKTPVIADNVTITGGAAYCYGMAATLEAEVPGNSNEMHYAWYDGSYTLLFDTVGVTSTYQPVVTGNATYYVNASTTDQCPILPPNYASILFNAANNGGTYQFTTEGEAIPFYDEGGLDGNYTTPNAEWTYTFKAPAGKQIAMKVNSFTGPCNGESLYVCDGLYNNCSNSWSFSGCDSYNIGQILQSRNGVLTVRWQNWTSSVYPNQIGWDAVVGILGSNGELTVEPINLASANVTLKSISAGQIHPIDAEICYGEDAVLQASSEIGVDQYYIWFEPDRITQHADTVHTIGDFSSFTVPSPREECTYYVAVYNDTTCPLAEPIYDDVSEMRFERISDSQDQPLTENKIYRIYDDGGPDGNYDNSGDFYTYRYFRLEGTDGYIKVHFDTIALANSNASLRISSTEGSWETIFNLSGPKYISDTDIVINNRRIQIEFRNYSPISAGGFEGSVCAITPHRMSDLIPVNVRFKTPEIEDGVNVTNANACYGEEISLTASVPGHTGNFHYVWYDENLNLMYEETGRTSTYTRLATANERYYVNAVRDGQCAMMSPDYGAILLNETTNGGTTVLTTNGEAISFYDEGGSRGNYSSRIISSDRWTYTFKAPAGKQVTMVMENFKGGCNGENLEIVDGQNMSYYERWLANYNCSPSNLPDTFTSSTGYITVSWSNNNSYINDNMVGWQALVGVLDNNGQMSRWMPENMQYGTVTLRPPVSPAQIVTTNAEICYGSEADLTARSSIAYPQYYTWYSPDRQEVVFRDTISSGVSTLSGVVPQQEETYYVAVSNDANCPVVESIHDRYEDDVLFVNSGNDYTLDESNIYRIYDDGGATGNYNATGNFYVYKYFNSNIANSQIKVHFDAIDLGNRETSISIQNQQDYSDVFRVQGPIHIVDTDIVVEASRVQIYFSNYSTVSDAGFSGYVHAITPHNINELAPASVTFTPPVIHNDIIVNDAEACFGDRALLTASNTSVPAPQNYAWFDENFNLLKQELVTGNESTYSPEVLGNTTYYVNVSADDECPVLPPNYGSLLFNQSINGLTTSLEEGNAVPFYDEGGPDGNFSTLNASWMHTFQAPEGKQVTLLMKSFRGTCNENFEIFDGANTDNQMNSYSCPQGNVNREYVSSGRYLTVRWNTYSSFSSNQPIGWDAEVGVKDNEGNMVVNHNLLVSAQVSVTPPTVGLPVTTSGDTVCFGEEAYIQAESNIDYPQYFIWYAPDGRTRLLKDTVDGVAKTRSELVAPGYYQYQDQKYYVAIGNDENCPAVLTTPTNSHTVLLNSSTGGQTTVLTPSDFVKFYDAGGLNSSYRDHNSDFTHTFQALQGNLRVKFSGDKDEMRIGAGDTLYIYDSETADNAHILGAVSYYRDEHDERILDYDTLSFVSTGHYLTFRFIQNGSYSNDGWNATIMPVDLLVDMDTVQVHVNVTSVPDAAITTKSDTICLGQEAVVMASAELSYPQYYVWYNSDMEILKRDTLHTEETPQSTLELPAHYNGATYYALIYSDTVSCVMNTNAQSKVLSELPFNANMSGVETPVTLIDSIHFYTTQTIRGNNNNSQYIDYYFTAEEGLIQIHFDELALTNDAELELRDDEWDMEYLYFEDNTYHDLTVTSMRNNMHLHFYVRSSSTSTISFDGTVTNINAVNHNALSNMAHADVVIDVDNTTVNISTTNDTVCVGSPALLTASSTIGFPQTYTWYNEDLSRIVFQETIQSGVSRFYIPGQVGNATYFVAVGNDTTCAPAFIESHDNFREFLFNDDLVSSGIYVGAVDSVVIYDDGGKDDDYIVPESQAQRIMKVTTLPGATFNIHIPYFETPGGEDAFFAIAEPDETGGIGENSPTMMINGTMSNINYSTSGNEVYLAWIIDDDAEPAAGFEVVLIADLHPESRMAEANVVMKNIMPIATNVLTADPESATICKGDGVNLSATSTLDGAPQYFIWYNNDLSTVLAVDTASGNTGNVIVDGLMQDTLLYVAVGTDEICPAYPLSSRPAISQILLNANATGDTTYISAVDSVLVYDDGGPSAPISSYGLFYHTFIAPVGQHIIVKFSEVKLENDDNFVAVGEVEGEVDQDDIRKAWTGTEIAPGDSIYVSSGNYLTIACNIGDLEMDDIHDGFVVSVYTDATLSSDMSALSYTFVTVNPSYHYTMYDTVCASTALYDVDKFLGIDISVPGDYTIDSVYHTALNCDSTYTLQLHVRENPEIAFVSVNPVSCNGKSDGEVILSADMVTGGEAPYTFVLYLDGTEVPSFSNLAAGTYKLVAQDVFGCFSDSATAVISEPETLHVVTCPTASTPYQLVPGETYVTVEFEDPTFAPETNNPAITDVTGKNADNHYGEGEHTITYTITNDCNEEVTCSVTFTVENADDIPPCIGCDSTATDPTDPTAGISCNSITNGTDSLAIELASGETTYTHADGSWDVTVTDNGGHTTLTCALSGATTATGLTTLNGRTFSEGVTTVTWTAVDDANNSSSCTFKVNVLPNEAPCIGCDSTATDPTDNTQGISCTSITSGTDSLAIELASGETTYTHADGSWDVTVTDNGGHTTLTCALSGATTATGLTTLNGRTFSEGVTTVTWTAVDDANNSSSCTFKVNVLPSEAPCIGCDSTATDPTDPTAGISCTSITDGTDSLAIELASGETTYTHADVSWDVTVTDNGGHTTLTCALNGATTATGLTTLNGRTFSEGVTTVTWTAVDDANNSSSCTFKVNVLPSEAPCIGCDSTAVDPTDPTAGISCTSITNGTDSLAIELASGETEYTHADVSWDVTVTDNGGHTTLTCALSGATTATGLTTLNGQTFNEGVTTVTWTAVDDANNSSSCTFKVNVLPNEAPCIGCDSTAVDPTDPTAGISCNSITNGTDSLAIELASGETEYTHADGSWDVTVTDNGGHTTLTCALTGATTATGLTTLNGQTFNEGVTTVTCTAVDDANNSSSCTFKVNVLPNEAPCIGCDSTATDPTDPTAGISCNSITSNTGTISVLAPVGTTTYTHSDDSWDVTVTDNGGHTTLTCVLSGVTTATGLTTLNGQIFNIGTTRVTWTATDDAGNPASCYFDVLVKDNNPVTVTIKENGAESTYDGYLQRVHGYTVQSISNSDYNVNDFAYVGPEEDTVITGRYVGDYPMTLKPEDFQNNNALFANVQFVIADSILKIKPNPNVITITAGSAQKPYDGVELTCENYTYTQGVLAMGDTLIAVTSGSRLDYGTSPNTIDEYRVFRNESLDGSMLRSISAPSGYTKDVTNQYTFATTEDGILEITKNGNVEVTITGHTGQYMYDGTTVYTVHGYDVSIVDTLNRYAITDFVFNGDSVLQDMNQGYYEMDMVQSDFVNNNENYGPVTFHIVQGWMKIHGELKVTPVVSVSSVCAGINNGAATIGITGGVPDYTYQITGANTGYSNSGTTSGNISLSDLAADQYTVSVVDAASFTANASFTIQEIPSILTPGNFEFECPAAITETLNYNECQMTINIGTPTFVNHMTDMEVTITNNAPEGNVFPQGTTEVVWTATDECGASLTCTQTIVVNYPPCGTAADSVADYDGIKYSSVRIGCQCWIGENLRSMHYSDGTPIADYRNYQDDPAKDTVFGKLYSWYSANRVAEDDDDTPAPTVTGPNGPYVQGACPDDWALPSDEDYRTLFETAGLVDYLKDPNPAYWLPGFAGVAPGTGFDARGAGWYDSDINRYMNLLGETYYWTSEPVTHVVNGHCAVITYYCPDGIIKDQKKGSGLSIRCIKMK